MIARRRVLAFVVPALTVAILGGGGLIMEGNAPPVGAGPITHTLAVTDDKFCSAGGSGCGNPKVLAINAGDTVDWQWQGTTGHDHTVTSCTGTPSFGTCNGAAFDSSPPKDSGSFQFTFPANGTFNYWCDVHGPDMRGVVQVGPTNTPSPSPTASPTGTPTVPATATPSPSPTATATPTPTPVITETATPTPTAPASATATATATGSAGPSATATASASPTATATATDVPTTSPTDVTASPSSTPLDGRSDVDCDGETDGDDVLGLLLHTADAGGAAPPGTCAPVGSDDGGGVKGDLNCDGEVDGKDALLALYVWAGLPLPPLPDCAP